MEGLEGLRRPRRSGGFLKTLAALAAGVLLGTAFSWSVADRAQAALRAEQAVSFDLMTKVGAACEPVYQAAWLDYECPPIIGGKLPAATKQVACTPAVRVYRSSEFEAVRLKAQAAGPLASILILEEKGAKEKPLQFDWRVERR